MTDSFSIPNLVIAGVRGINFRGKARLLNLLCPKAGTKRSPIFGSTFDLDLADFIQRQIYLGTFERRETRLVKTFLQSGMTFVDVGANVGYYTALAAKRVAGKGGRVIAFEPSPYAFGKLQSMLLANRIEYVTVVNAGLSDMAGYRGLYLGVGSQNHTPTMVAHENTTAIEVPVVTLDDEAERLGIEQIDLMKIDVEGHEPKVLNGAKRLLGEGRIRAVLCEFNEHWLGRAGSSTQDLERILNGAGLVETEDKSAPVSTDNRFFQLRG